MASLVADLRWLEISDEFAERKEFSLSQWVDYVRNSPKVVFNRIRKYCRSPFANIVTQWADTPTLHVFAQPVVCDECGKLSKSFQAHALHMASKHKVKSVYQRFIDGPVCRVCLVQFWTR